MATTIPLFTPLSDPPAKTDSATDFENKGDIFLGELPNFGTEGNAFGTAANSMAAELETLESNVIGYKETAEEWATKINTVVDSTDYSSKEYAIGSTAPSAKKYANADEDVEIEAGKYSGKHWALKSKRDSDIAQSIANFVGNWGDQTGSAAIPTSVAHNGKVWLLLQNLADITLSEPSIYNTDWLLNDPTPAGIVVMWSGSIITIPDGYLLCDGTNSTPDLRNMFIVGAGSTYAVDDTGGSLTHDHTDTLVSGATTLTEAQMPSHDHRLNSNSTDGTRPYGFGNSNGYCVSGKEINGGTLAFYSTGGTGVDLMEDTGGDTSHSHALSGSVSSASAPPPYYALAYIMKT